MKLVVFLWVQSTQLHFHDLSVVLLSSTQGDCNLFVSILSVSCQYLSLSLPQHALCWFERSRCWGKVKCWFLLSERRVQFPCTDFCDYESWFCPLTFRRRLLLFFIMRNDCTSIFGVPRMKWMTWMIMNVWITCSFDWMVCWELCSYVRYVWMNGGFSSP